MDEPVSVWLEQNLMDLRAKVIQIGENIVTKTQEIVVMGIVGNLVGIRIAVELGAKFTQVLVLESVNIVQKGTQIYLDLLYPNASTTVEKIPEQVTHFSEPADRYAWKGTKIRIGNKEIDEYIEAYETLHVNIVQVILETHQLVDFGFIRERYKNLQKEYHPDRNPETAKYSMDINLAYEKIKKLKNDEQTQFYIIETILTWKGRTQKQNIGLSYTILFVGAAVTTGVVVSMKGLTREKKNK